jgi:predicted nucleotidyltransferase
LIVKEVEILIEGCRFTVLKPPRALIADLTERITRVVRPRHLQLFGSAARTEWTPDRDLDVLIVVEDGANRRKIAQAIYRELIGFGHAVDLVVVTESDVARHRKNPSLVIQPALDEGVALDVG